MDIEDHVLYLCGGLQSSGSTLVSWCFLQRTDMDGILDADNDLLPRLDAAIGRPHLWYKTTICCFRLAELVDHYRDEGWAVRPLLVVRDLRHVWSSLRRKPYGRNGITAEDPPLKLRVRRLVADWQTFRRNDWPILRYEDLLEEPARTLQDSCRQLGLPWDDAMLSWPKSEEEILDARWGNANFRASRGAGLLETLRNARSGSRRLQIPGEELEWLQSEFCEFHAANRYPLDLEGVDTRAAATPQGFGATRRYEWETRRKPVRWLLARLGVPYRKLIERRSIRKRAA